MPQIVQFTHPGGEHGPDQRNGNHKSWNTGAHRRKFMSAKGEYVGHSNRSSEMGPLAFWGEWEPSSHVHPLQQPNPLFPKWLHEPYLPNPIPGLPGLQNTDPFVFGDQFRYFVCKQYRPSTFRETSLSKLDPGSIILFGSTKTFQGVTFFQLDTVFVVDSWINYNTSNPAAAQQQLPADYYHAVFEKAWPNPTVLPLHMRVYNGANFSNQVNDTYSFAPAKIWKGGNIGFERVQLFNLPYITNNLNAMPKVTTVSNHDAKTFWQKIRHISRASGCVEGVRFFY